MLENVKIDYLPLDSEDPLREIKKRIKQRLLKRRGNARNIIGRQASRTTK